MTAVVDSGVTHHMTFKHSTAGVIRSSWTVTLVKNGVVMSSIPVSMIEVKSGIYDFSFTNDSTHNSFWTLVVSDAGSPSVSYGESWIVRNAIEGTLSSIKSSLDSFTQRSGQVIRYQ